MKSIIVLLMTVFLFEAVAQKKDYPVLDKENVKAGTFNSNLGYSKNSRNKNYPKKIPTTFGTIAVKENRENQDSRIITLPIKKLHSFNENPLEPIFLLFGGPGISNIKGVPYISLLENHDLIMIGYRGLDGDVSLASKEIGESMVTNGNPFGTENLKKMGEVSNKVYNNFKEQGIDVDAYNMVEVINDIESARIALGYDKINLFGMSYGTRLAYYYGLEYPENVNRTIIEAVNPPGRFVWEPEYIDSLYMYLGEQWKKDAVCTARTPDIVQTMKNVIGELPIKWKSVTIDPDKVKMMMFMMSYGRDGMVKVFDAFVAAENGDYSGLAFLSMFFDQLPNMEGMNWGDNFAKALSADYDPNRDYESEMDPPGSIIGSPMSKLFGLMKYGGWPMKTIPEEYKKLRYSNVETLLISGNIDISTPAQNGTEMLSYLPNGHQVILKNRGHQDMGLFEPKAYYHMINTFLQTGEFDDSRFTEVPIDFENTKLSFQKMGKIFHTLNKLHLTGMVMGFM